MSYCISETNIDTKRRKGQEKDRAECLEIANAIAEISSLEGLEDKVSDINQGEEQKGQDVENKK